jgi:transcriptional regulator NrdR family protein
MVCIYCGGSTEVKNSRLQKRVNQVWRRRYCKQCGAIFSTQEVVQLSTALMVRYSGKNQLRPFSRDELFLSIYESCKHRRKAIDDTSAITQTIISRLNGMSDTGSVLYTELVDVVRSVLKNFDQTALAVYEGLHTTREI